MRFLIILALVLSFAAPASAGWKTTSGVTGSDVTTPTIKYRGNFQKLFHRFTGAGNLDVIQVGADTLAKFCVNANTGGTGLNDVALQAFYFHNQEETGSLNDATPVLNITLTGGDGADCIYDNDPGFYIFVVTTGPTANEAYVSVVRTQKTN